MKRIVFRRNLLIRKTSLRPNIAKWTKNESKDQFASPKGQLWTQKRKFNSNYFPNRNVFASPAGCAWKHFDSGNLWFKNLFWHGFGAKMDQNTKVILSLWDPPWFVSPWGGRKQETRIRRGGPTAMWNSCFLENENSAKPKMSSQDHQETIRFIDKTHMGNPPAQNLIKPVVYWDFWGPFREITPKSIKKAIGFPLKVDGVLRHCEMSEKHWS